MTRVATASTTKAGDAGATELATALSRDLAGDTPKLVCVWASTSQPLGPLLAALQGTFAGCAVIGSSTAGEFTETGDSNGEAVAVAIAGELVVDAGMGRGLRADSGAAIETALTGLRTSVEGYPHRSALLLFDGLSGVGEEVTLQASLLLGDDVKVAGAAAGDDWQVQETTVGAGRVSASDAVVLCLIHTKHPVGVGVRHGHEPFSDSCVVTKSQGAVVHELDGKPAWDRYLELTRAEALRQGAPDPATLHDAGPLLQHFSRFSSALRTGGEWRNRTPLSKAADGALSFTCGIAVGTKLTVLRSDPEKQLASAVRAAADALADLGGACAGAVVFDCVCRKVVLGDQFAATARAIAKTLGAPLAGFKSYGEIALRAGDYSGFHNATTVVLAFPA